MFSFGQTADSLLIKSQKASGNEKIDLLNQLAEAIVNTDPNKTKLYAEQALTLSEKSSYTIGIINAHHKLGIFYYYTDDYDKSIQYYKKSLALAKKVGDKKLSAQALSWMGSLFRVQSDFVQALQYYDQALKIAKEINDVNRIIYCFRSIGEVYRVQQENNKALEYFDKALKLTEKIKDNGQAAYILTAIGEVYRLSGQYPKSLIYLNQASALAKKSNNYSLVSNNYYSLGEIYVVQNRYAQALENFQKALTMGKQIKDNRRIADCYASMGDIYLEQNEKDKAKEFYNRSLSISKEIDYMQNYAYCLSVIGDIYETTDNADLSLQYFNQALKVGEEIHDKHRVTACLSKLLEYYQRKKDFTKALEYGEQALKQSKEIEDYVSIALCYTLIGEVYYELKNYEKAITNGESALKTAKEFNLIKKIEDAGLLLFKAYNEKNRFEDALEMHVMSTEMRDSMRNQENTKKLVEQQVTFEFKEKEAIRKIEQTKRDLENEARLHRQQLIGIGSAVGFGLMIVLSLVIYRSQRKQKFANIKLEKQKLQIEDQAKEITDSINYAREIQNAILPERSEINTALKDMFVLYIPKDIVSGDFYYFHSFAKAETLEGAKQSKSTANYPDLIIAAADCTGHGVPGAFMSMISSQKIDEAVKQVQEPKNILKKINRNLKTALKQKQNDIISDDFSSKDGLDIALCSLSMTENNNAMLKYAGANRPIWIIPKDNQVTTEDPNTIITEIKATKAAIGGFTSDDQVFEQHDLEIKSGDSFYIFTDGITDQFGGEKGKKLTTKKFKQVITSICDKSMKDQEIALRKIFEDWKMHYPQVDDILVIGVRV